MLVGVDNISVRHPHACDIYRSGVVHHMHKGMGRQHTCCQHLKTRSNIRYITYAAVSDHTLATQTFVDVGIHLTPQAAVAIVSIEILNHRDTGFGTAVDVLVISIR